MVRKQNKLQIIARNKCRTNSCTTNASKQITRQAQPGNAFYTQKTLILTFFNKRGNLCNALSKETLSRDSKQQ